MPSAPVVPSPATSTDAAPAASPTQLDGFEHLLQSQRHAVEALLSWQRLMCEQQLDLWDRCRCVWGGGAPLDG
jgi:hypothetical protein